MSISYVKVTRKLFLRELEIAAKAVESSASIPILQTVMLDAAVHGSTVMAITGTDLEMWMTCRCALEETDCKLSCCVPVKPLIKALRGMDSAMVSVTQSGPEEVTVTDGKSSVTLPSLPTGGFPVPGVESKSVNFSVHPPTLVDCITRTVFAVDKSRSPRVPALQDVLFGLDGGVLRMTASDGARISQFEHIVGANPTDKLSIQVPPAPLRKLSWILKGAAQCSVIVGERLLQARADSWVVLVRLNGGQAPIWSGVNAALGKPSPSPHKAWVSREHFRQALKRAAEYVKSDTNRPVQLSFGEFALSIAAGSESKYAETMPCLHTVDQAEEGVTAMVAGISVAFNCTFLLEFLGSCVEESVTILMSGETKPVEFQPTGNPNHRYIVQPIRM